MFITLTITIAAIMPFQIMVLKQPKGAWVTREDRIGMTTRGSGRRLNALVGGISHLYLT